jgi:hypothetical protein
VSSTHSSGICFGVGGIHVNRNDNSTRENSLNSLCLGCFYFIFFELEASFGFCMVLVRENFKDVIFIREFIKGGE